MRVRQLISDDIADRGLAGLQAPPHPHRTLALVAALSVVVFLPTLRYGFVWDDVILVEHNQFLQQYASPSSFLGKDFTQLSFGAVAGGFYRPLFAITLWADAVAWGLKPIGFHLTNLLLQGIAVILLWLVVRRLSGPLGATLTSLLFAVHPAHTEVAAFISGRVDSLALAPMLAGLWLFLRLDQTQDRWWSVLRHLGLAGAAGLALAAKESAVIFPALLLIVGLFGPENTGRSHTARLRMATLKAAGVLMVTGAYAVWRWVPLTGYLTEPLGHTHLTTRVWVAVEAFGYYTIQALLPIPLGPERYPPVPHSPWDLSVALGWACLLGVGCWLAWAWRRHPAVAIGLCWYIVSVAPVVAALPISQAGEFVLAERWLYAPSAGMMLALVATVQQWVTQAESPTRSRCAAAGLAAWGVIALGSLAWITPVWESDSAFRRYILARNPTASGPLINVAVLEMRDGKPEAALNLLRQAVAVAPNDTNAWLNLGMAMRELKRYDGALAAFKRSVQLAPSWVIPPMYLSSVYYDTGRHADGIELMRSVVRRAPNFAQAHLFLGGFYEQAGRLDDAVAAYREAIRLDPRNRNAFQCLARTHGRMGSWRAAVSTIEDGLAARPGDPVLQAELAQLYEDAGQRAKARPLWEAVASHVGDPDLARLAAVQLAR